MHNLKSVWGPEEGKQLGILGDPFICKTVGADTDNSWAFFAATVLPGSVVPNHKHDGFDEAFYIIEGELEMSTNGEVMTATPGHFINVQRGTVHGYRNLTNAPVKILTWTHPAGIEHFYEEVAENVKTLPEDLGKLLTIAEKHRIELMPPSAE